MSGFDFSTLNSSDLEELVRDLLNAQAKRAGLPTVYRTFKEGRDRGIDLLYSTSINDYEIVGQVKHYYRSGVPALLRHLKDEAAKVNKLKPQQYVVATSLELSAANIQEIKEIFEPHIHNLSDIHDKILLNLLLDQFPDILRRHHKLWFSNTEVLRTILQYDVEGRSNEFRENELKKRLRLYVETPGLHAARSVLEKNNFIIITGQPGVGKTTIAEILVYEMIKDGYELIYIYDDIKEAEAVLNDPNRKVIFYFDDFLGHNAVEIEKARGSETVLLKTLRRITSSGNKKFIFTTRTFILNNAVEGSEKLRQFNIKAQESLIPLAVYTDTLKLKLLNNHIEESSLGELHKVILRRPDIQDFIIRHESFSPRSVAFITSSTTLSEISPEEFGNYIRENFNRPDEIWRHAYEQQIDDLARLLLNTMVSFGNSVQVNELEIAFNRRLDYEAQHNNFQKPLHPFRNAFRRLENGFIVADSHSHRHILFINPSLVDFLLNSIRSDQGEVIRIAEAASYIQQLTVRLYTLESIREGITIPRRLEHRIMNNYSEFIYPETSESDEIKLALFVYYYLNNDPLVIELIDRDKDWVQLQGNTNVTTLFISFLENINAPNIIELIQSKAQDVFIPMLENVSDIDDFESIMSLAFSKFTFTPEAYPDLLDDLNEIASSLLNEKIEQDIDELKGYSHAQDFVNEKEEEAESLKENLENFGLSVHASFSEYNAYDWWEIGTHNYFAEQMAKDD